MSDCKIYPADTVDATGYAWPTVGENIRNGGFPGKEIKSIDIVINNGAIVNKPSFVQDNIVDYYIVFIEKCICAAVPIKSSKGFIKIDAYSISNRNGYLYLTAKDSTGIIRVFYYDN